MGGAIIALMLVAQAAQQSDRWVSVVQTTEQTDYIDARTIQIEGDRRIFWDRAVYTRPRADRIASQLFHVEMDCGRRTQALLGGTDYDQSGRVVESHDIADPQFSSVIPDSRGERLLETVCGLHSN